jgi:DNA invertase Pin-like site-specific DNA recombinase
MSDQAASPNRAKTAAIYARVSREDKPAEGEEKKGHNQVSIDQQIEDAQALATRLGYGSTIVYMDRDVSGNVPPRQIAPKARKVRLGLTALIQDAQDGKVQAIIIRKLDRLTRGNLSNATQIYNILSTLGLTLLATHESLPTGTDASSELTLNMLLSISRFERQKISENSLATKAHQKRNGLIYHPVNSFGFVTKNGEVAVNPTEAAIVRQMITWLSEGVSLMEIARKLFAAKVKTRRGGKGWTNNNVKSVLTNEQLAGLKDGSPCDWIPAIISEAEFARLQDALAHRTRTKEHSRAPQNIYSSIAKCGYCGRAMQRLRDTVRCPSHVFDKSGTHAKTIYVEVLDWIFDNFIINAMVDKAEITVEQSAKILNLVRTRERLKADMVSGELDYDSFKSTLQAIETKIAKLRDTQGLSQVSRQVKIKQWTELTVVEKRMALGDVLEGLHVYGDGILVRFSGTAKVDHVEVMVDTLWLPFIKLGHKSRTTVAPTGLVGLVEYLGVHGLGSVWGIDHESPLESHQQAG